MAELDSINQIVQQATKRIGDDVGALIGDELICNVSEGVVVPAAGLAQKLSGKLVLSRLAVSGDRSGEAYLVTPVRTAIAMGGRLIMLPTEELASRVESNNFDGELADAFEEIANIVTGSLNTIFEANPGRKLHFKKLEVKLEKVPDGPAQILPVFGDSHYYLVSGSNMAGGQDLGPFWLVFPPALFDLPIPAAVGSAAEEADASPAKSSAPGAKTTAPAPGTTAGPATGAGGPPPSSEGKSLCVLIVAEEADEGAHIAACLNRNNFQPQQVEIQGDHRKALLEKDFGGVLLVMREVGELGFATVIKLRSAMKPAIPLIVAGPEWTRKSVLQALKYGASDILVSPVADDELLAKLREYLGTPP